MKAYDNKIGLLECALKPIMDPHGGLNRTMLDHVSMYVSMVNYQISCFGRWACEVLEKYDMTIIQRAVCFQLLR